MKAWGRTLLAVAGMLGCIGAASAQDTTIRALVPRAVMRAPRSPRAAVSGSPASTPAFCESALSGGVEQSLMLIGSDVDGLIDQQYRYSVVDPVGLV